jgi:GntP family gluconate:H+ symporter
MVPPTPGPVAAAGILGADLGLVIIIGISVGIVALIATTIFAQKVAGKVLIDPVQQLNQEQLSPEINDNPLEKTPSPWKSFLPVVIPIILIIINSIAGYPTHPFGEGKIKDLLSFIGNPVVALIIGMILSFMLPVKLEKKMLAADGWVGEALKNAAIIILITGAGGAFGKVLQNSDMGKILGDMIGGSKLGLWLPFLIAAALKTAQGSSTVAIITTASMISPLMSILGFDSELSKAMAVVAIGAGSCVVSHANDSYFWVVTQLSGMNIKQGYKLMSTGSAILGITAIILLTIINLFL